MCGFKNNDQWQEAEGAGILIYTAGIMFRTPNEAAAKNYRRVSCPQD